MTDINKRASDCDDDCEGERGKRGHRGHRGHDGHDGETGPTGPAGGGTGSTGPAGPAGTAANTGATGPTGPATATGDPNTQAYFGPAGTLTDDTFATMTLADWIQNTNGVPGAAGQAVHINRALRSVAIGQSSVASGLNSFAQGNGANASGQASHAEGFSTQASGDGSHAEGNATIASGGLAHAEGFLSQATGDQSHAEGIGSIAGGVAAHAEGIGTQASGDGSHSEGNGTVASGATSHAGGVQTVAFREGQWAQSSGQGGLTPSAAGASQTNIVTMTGETPGAAPAEAVELVLGVGLGALVLEDGKDYTFTVTVAAGAVQPGPVRVGRGFIIYFNVRRDAGTSVITASGVGQAFGDATTADWTFVATIGAAPDRVVLTFTTGAVNSAAKVTADVKFVEILY